MLKKLIIKNFQNIKYEEIEFDKYVTIFVGPNDSGKSARIRALFYLAFNRPVGTAFIRHGRKQATIQLFFDSANIKRVVGKNGFYSLNGKKFKAVGRSVPPEITDILNVTEINFQQQHFPLFWFGLTPPQAAKELNKLVDLESIDRVQALVAKRLREKKAELAVAKKRWALAHSEITLLKPVKMLNVKLGKLELRQNDIALESSRIDSLGGLCGGCVGADTVAQMAANASRSGAVAGAVGAAAVEATDRAGTLAGLVAGLERAERSLSVQIPKLPEPVEDKGTVGQLSELVVRFEVFSEDISIAETKLEKAKANLEKKLGGRCPTCGNLLTDKTLI